MQAHGKPDFLSLMKIHKEYFANVNEYESNFRGE